MFKGTVRVRIAGLLSLTFLFSGTGVQAAQSNGFHRRNSSECTSVDVRDQLPKSLRLYFSHMRNQGDLGFCYAMTASDLLGFATGIPASGLYLWVNYTNNLSAFDRSWRWAVSQINPERGSLDGGMLTDALQESLASGSFGICSESALPSSHPDVEYQALLNEMNTICENPDRANPAKVTEAAQALHELFPSQSLESLQSKLGSQCKDTMSFLTALSQSACSEKMIPTPSGYEVRTYSDLDADPVGVVDSQLDLPKPNIVGIMYDYGYTRKDESPLPLALDNFIGVHVSSVIARRYDSAKNQCEYLIRDSFGADCSRYQSQNVDCEKDGIWVSDQLLHHMTASVSYLQKDQAR